MIRFMDTFLKMAKNTSSESRSRAYTKKELSALGWNVKHPSKGGDILEEQEAKYFDERFDELLGKERPDFLICQNNIPVIVIENINDNKKIDIATKEAQEYADTLSKKYFDVKVVSAVAGDDENGVVVRTYLKIKKQWILVNANNYPFLTIISK